MLALDDHGRVLECNPTCEQRFGYRRDELTGRHISTLFPELEGIELVMDERINSRLAFLCHSGIPFQARHRDGKKLASELFINRLDRHNVVLLARSLDKTGRDRTR
jgi:PAS domain S-box-containing protein